MPFVHLHVHSQFSLLDGTLDPSAIVKLAAGAGMSAVALTDTANLFGAVGFYKSCKAAKVHPVIGAELHVQPEGLDFEDPRREAGGFQLLALVEDEVGYKNLCGLLTDGFYVGMKYKPRVDLARLLERQAGLIFLAGGRKGPFGRPLLRGDEAAGVGHFRRLHEGLGPDALFVELVDVGIDGDERVNALARRLSAESGRPLVVTNAVHYAKAEDSPVHELLNAVAQGCSAAHADRQRSPTDQAYFKTEAEIRELFPDDGEAIDRTAVVAHRCHYKFVTDVYHFPAAVPPDVGDGADTDANWSFFYRAFPPPQDYGLPDPDVAIPERPPGAGNLNGYFDWYAERGLELRLVDVAPELHPSYRDRLATELRIIRSMGFPAYLLIVAEFINWSKDNGIPVGPGRGSAAGSLVAYSMRITDIDPILFDLLFERFLNPERVSMPDIDVDFCQDRRDESIQHVRQKYGEAFVSQIITYGKLKAKAAVKDVARALDLSFNEADVIAKLVPDELGITLASAIEQSELLKLRQQGDAKVRRVLAMARAVEGNVRQTGVHAAGVVIADRPLVEYAPLYVDEVGSVPAVQFDMKSAETVGLIKFDFLGLKTLDQIRDAVALVQRNHGVSIDIRRIPTNDAATFALLQKGDGLGIFQLESQGMQKLLVKLAPSCLDDLVALVALYRPGPLQSGMVDDFVERKHGRRQVAYPLPMLEPILRSTYGTIVYQEQVMQCAQVMAGYSLGEADLLRRAMGKKNASEMAQQKTRFVSGSVANGIDAAKADEIFSLLEKFAEYGFNKSHSAAYGLVSYQTAYLKAHHRAEYMAALMTIDADNTDKILGYLEDCRKNGIRIDPVSIAASDRGFDAPPAARGEAIQYGLRAVKGVGEGAIDAVLEARARGPFRDPYDVILRIDSRRANRKFFESLIKAGAFDSYAVPRRALMEGLDAAMGAAARQQADAAAGQGTLFGGAKRAPSFRFPDVPEWPLAEKLTYEKEVLGLYLSGHPIQAHTRDVARFATTNLGELESVKANVEVRVVVLPTDVRVTKTGRGDKMGIVRLEDDHGMVEAVFFPEPWARSGRAVQSGKPVVVTGRVELRGESLQIRANSAELLSEMRVRTVVEVRVNVGLDELDGDRLDKLRELLRKESGQCRTRLTLRRGQVWEAELDLPDLPVEPSFELESSLQQLFGRSDVVSFA